MKKGRVICCFIVFLELAFACFLLRNVMVQEQNVSEAAYEPHMQMDRGSYQITVEYNCERNQIFQAHTNQKGLLRLRARAVILPKNKTSVSWKFSLLEDKDRFSSSPQDVICISDTVSPCRRLLLFSEKDMERA